MKLRKAYSYIRMSTDTQLKGDSLRRQLEASEAYAKNNNLELVDSINGVPLKDIGVSAFKGKNTQKGVLSVFLEALNAGKIENNSVLLVESLDRLSRDRLTEALAQFMNIISQGIEIITLADNQRYTKEILNQSAGPLFLSLGIMFRANEESEMKSKRISAVWEQKRNNATNKAISRKCPNWLKYSEASGKFEIIEERAEVVRKIFKMCIDTCGLWTVTRYLNNNKIPVFGRGKVWYNPYVTSLIKDRSVLGEFQPSTFKNGFREDAGEPIRSYFPQLIDEHTFLLAQSAVARRTSHNNGRKGKNYTNLFSGLTFCASCGFRMGVKTGGDRAKNPKAYLECSNKLVGGGCSNKHYWSLTDFENLMIRHLNEVNFQDLLNDSEAKKVENLDDKLDALSQKIKDLENKINQTIDYKFAPDLAEATQKRYDQRIAQFEIEIEAAKKEMSLTAEQKSTQEEASNSFKSSEVKKLLEELNKRADDYMFRSSINQLLVKMIDKVELKESNEIYMPSELNEASPEVIEFRSTYKNSSTKTLDQILKSKRFQNLFKSFHRTVTVRYRSGAVRYLMCGAKVSIQTRSPKIK